MKVSVKVLTKIERQTCVCACVCVRACLELGELLHQLLLLLAVAQRGEDVQEDLEEVQTLPRHTGQGEDGCDAAHTHTHTQRKRD